MLTASSPEELKNILSDLGDGDIAKFSIGQHEAWFGKVRNQIIHIDSHGRGVPENVKDSIKELESENIKLLDLTGRARFEMLKAHDWNFENLPSPPENPLMQLERAIKMKSLGRSDEDVINDYLHLPIKTAPMASVSKGGLFGKPVNTVQPREISNNNRPQKGH